MPRLPRSRPWMGTGSSVDSQRAAWLIIGRGSDRCCRLAGRSSFRGRAGGPGTTRPYRAFAARRPGSSLSPRSGRWFGRTVQRPVGVGELAERLTYVVRLLHPLARPPLAAGLVDEVAAVHVDGARQTIAGIGYPVDGVVAQHHHLAGDELLAARLGQLPAIGAGAPVEAVVLLAGVDPDRRPHPVVVRV